MNAGTALQMNFSAVSDFVKSEKTHLFQVVSLNAVRCQKYTEALLDALSTVAEGYAYITKNEENSNLNIIYTHLNSFEINMQSLLSAYQACFKQAKNDTNKSIEYYKKEKILKKILKDTQEPLGLLELEFTKVSLDNMNFTPLEDLPSKGVSE